VVAVVAPALMLVAVALVACVLAQDML